LRNTFSAVIGTQAYLRHVYGLDAASIVHTVRTKLGVGAETRVTC